LFVVVVVVIHIWLRLSVHGKILRNVESTSHIVFTTRLFVVIFLDFAASRRTTPPLQLDYMLGFGKGGIVVDRWALALVVFWGGRRTVLS
jgi:hypothetical protein